MLASVRLSYLRIDLARGSLSKAKCSVPRRRGSTNDIRKAKLAAMRACNDYDNSEPDDWQVSLKSFDGVCREALETVCPDKSLRISKDAVQVLLTGASSAIAQLMADADALRKHGKRSTLWAADLRLATQLRERWGDVTLHGATRRASDEIDLKYEVRAMLHSSRFCHESNISLKASLCACACCSFFPAGSPD